MTKHCEVCEKTTKHVALFGGKVTCLPCLCKPAAEAFFIEKGLVACK